MIWVFLSIFVISLAYYLFFVSLEDRKRSIIDDLRKLDRIQDELREMRRRRDLVAREANLQEALHSEPVEQEKPNRYQIARGQNSDG